MFYRHLLAVMLAFAAFPALADDTVTTADDRAALTLTVYQQNLALISDLRRVELPDGRVRLAVAGVPSALIPESVLADGTTPGRLDIVGQFYETALLSPEALLRAAEGGTVQIITTNPDTGVDSFAPAELLRAQGRQALVRQDGRIRTLGVGRIAFDSAPANLRARPTLVLDMDVAQAGPETLALRYLTGGLSWKTDYVAEISKDEKHLRLAGWVTLQNGTETAFEDATLRVVAGNVNRQATVRPMLTAMRAKTAMAEAAPMPRETSVTDLRVYDFADKVDIGAGEKRQLALFPAASVAVAKEYRLEGDSSRFARPWRDMARSYPAVRYKFANTAAAGLGRHLPSGTVRLYAPSDGGPVYRGEDSIQHTPVGESIILTAGLATDITGERKQTEFERDGLSKNVTESAHQIVLHNGKKEPVEVVVVEHIPGDWKMLAESQAHTKPVSDQAVWTVRVPAEGKAELTYRVRVRF